MTKIVVQPNASGTGTFTIAAPNSNNARTLTLPDAAGTVFLSDGSGTIQPTNITDGTTTVGTSYVVNGSAKAWVNFNGAGTIAIRDSFNVASLTDNGTGNYTVTFSNAFAAADFAASGTGLTFSGANAYLAGPSIDGPGSGITASTVRCYAFIQGSGLNDLSTVCATAHGDLA